MVTGAGTMFDRGARARARPALTPAPALRHGWLRQCGSSRCPCDGRVRPGAPSERQARTPSTSIRTGTRPPATAAGCGDEHTDPPGLGMAGAAEDRATRSAAGH
ncbi:Nucleoside triphosphate pyrophosphatase [Frankliniella fusca]|uniref:Nucleoside triphosphate pyrophosphatase n=1 Tax=Frankliniella fusca TaxID=407009 RepID=A0AAE1I337_9NEOP|nr:Nucleoside triphosphate pyrophosphatase [Frankliniella fusca]